MKHSRILFALGAVSLFSATGAANGASPSSRSSLMAGWDLRLTEHLLNRAGFGARPAEIEACAALGQEALVDKLLDQRAGSDPFWIERHDPPPKRELRELPDAERQKIERDYRERDRRQLVEYTGWWLDRMLSGDDPLLERMSLFWHGLFTTSAESVRRTYEVLKQDQFLHANALTSYAALLKGIVHDPAMLTYLDNQVSRKGNPNENLARELMELFSLGQGNYTEQDIKEGARALTGFGVNDLGEFEFHPRQHDDGDKTILGRTGKFDGDDFVKILLEQEACPRYIAKRMLTYFEGFEPSKERLESYAQFLRQQDFEIKPFLRRLFLDPEFYRPEILGGRVLGPVEYMVGMTRRLGIKTPAIVVGAGAALLGQRLFAPPSVKGWDEGEAWITTSSLMQRGNLAGMLIGVVNIDDVLSMADMDKLAATDENSDDPMMSGGMMSGGDAKDPAHPWKGESAPEPRKAERKSANGANPAGKAPEKPGFKGNGGVAFQMLRRVQDAGWAPAVNFSARLQRSGAKTDAEIVDRMLDELLAIEPPADTRQKMLDYLSKERIQLDLKEGHLYEAQGDAERVLRRLAHLILSLPEAQLG